MIVSTGLIVIFCTQNAPPKELVVTEELEKGTVVTNITAIDGDDGKFGEIHYLITGRRTNEHRWHLVAVVTNS